MGRKPSGNDQQWLSKISGRANAILIDRRAMLLGLGAAGAAATLPNCSSSTTPGKTTPNATSMFRSYATLRDLIRQSPDHLSARAAEVIASKDFTSAVRFVRDRIAVLPPSRATDAATDAVRWGPDGALRAGAGTQRERAELLKAMLTAMGASAKVVYADLPAGIDATALYATRPPKFSVDTSKFGSLGPSAAKIFAHVNEPNPDPDPSGVLSSLLALIPSGQATAQNPFDGLDTQVPVVEYTAKGTTKWAFALGDVDEVSSAPAGLGAELSPAQYPSVSLRLLAKMGNVPGVPNPPGLVELVSGKWTADQLAGSRLLITTASSDPTATVGAPSDQVTIRTPLMQVKPPTPLTGKGDPALWSPSVGLPAAKPAGGSPFSLSGSQFTSPANASGPPAGPYGSYSQLDDKAHAAALASVASLQAVANGGAFPDVVLTVSALDKGGAPVFGLTPSDFVIADEGTTQAPVMLSNAGVEKLEVMLAYDCSGSITWPTPADKTSFDSELANAMVAAALTTPYLLGVASMGSKPADGYLAPDATKIQSEIASCASFSDVWTTLGQVVPGDGVSAVVMVSDFQASDDPAAIPALKQALAASGIAVALIPMGQPDQSTIDAIVQTCGAVVLDSKAADFQQKLSDFVSNATKLAKISGYRFAYRIPADQQSNQDTRSVEVSLANAASVAGVAKYQVPAADARGSVGVAGLYLELSIGTSATVRRRLSGPALDRFGNPTAAVAADYAATRELLNGLVTVAFEPGSPTAAQNAEDVLACALSMQPVFDAVGKTLKDALDAASGIQLYSSPLGILVDPTNPPEADPVVAPEWMRVVIATQTVGDKGMSYRTDIVPQLNASVAGSKDASAAFESVVRSGVALCLRESQVMPTSAAKTLDGVGLQYLAPSANPTTLKGFSSADLAKWQPLFDLYGDWHMFVPTNPAVGAAWIVEPKTGTTVAVFLDGSGGGCGAEKANALLQDALALIQVAIALVVMRCEETEGASFGCDGALVFSVGALVVALFAGGIFHQELAVDILVGASALALFAAPAIVGLGLAVLGFLVAMAEGLESLNQPC